MENKKKNFGKIILISGIILILIAIILILIIKPKTQNTDDIKVSELNYIEPLKEEDEVLAAKTIKSNIVKITNKIDDNTSVVGTGFFIQEGYLITNSHIVDIMGEITIEYQDGTKSKAYLYSNSLEYDIALLKVETIKAKALSFINSNTKEVTNEVLSAGYIYNFAGEATISKGILSAKRNMNNFTYLQSDISIDTGSSGGPLFDAKAAVVGINIYVTENRTFALSLSSESTNMIIDALLETPTINYLTEKRPSNSINSILVEVGYTQNTNLDLYNDFEKIKRSKKEYEKELKEETKKENVNTNTHNPNKPKETYYCEEGNLIGKKCIKQTRYDATLKETEECKAGYTKNGFECTKKEIVEAEAYYNCNGTLTENKTCLEKHLWESSAGGSRRIGSCPKGENCYDEGTSYLSYEVFITDLICPKNSTKIYSGTKIVWTNQEFIKENFKTWNSSIHSYKKTSDKDGLIYYEENYNSLALCAKEYNNENNVYITYTYDELKDTACPNGGTLTANTNNQGFYCKLQEKPHKYSWGHSCYDTAYSVMQTSRGDVVCGKWVEEEHNVEPIYSCKNGNMQPDGKTCLVEDIYRLPTNYVCNNNDTQDGTQCIKTEITDAKKST